MADLVHSPQRLVLNINFKQMLSSMLLPMVLQQLFLRGKYLADKSCSNLPVKAVSTSLMNSTFYSALHDQNKFFSSHAKNLVQRPVQPCCCSLGSDVKSDYQLMFVDDGEDKMRRCLHFCFWTSIDKLHTRYQVASTF